MGLSVFFFLAQSAIGVFWGYKLATASTTTQAVCAVFWLLWCAYWALGAARRFFRLRKEQETP